MFQNEGMVSRIIMFRYCYWEKFWLRAPPPQPCQPKRVLFLFVFLFMLFFLSQDCLFSKFFCCHLFFTFLSFHVFMMIYLFGQTPEFCFCFCLRGEAYPARQPVPKILAWSIPSSSHPYITAWHGWRKVCVDDLGKKQESAGCCLEQQNVPASPCPSSQPAPRDGGWEVGDLPACLPCLSGIRPELSYISQERGMHAWQQKAACFWGTAKFIFAVCMVQACLQ